jgi:hypothetical protein
LKESPPFPSAFDGALIYRNSALDLLGRALIELVSSGAGVALNAAKDDVGSLMLHPAAKRHAAKIVATAAVTTPVLQIMPQTRCITRLSVAAESKELLNWARSAKTLERCLKTGPSSIDCLSSLPSLSVGRACVIDPRRRSRRYRPNYRYGGERLDEGPALKPAEAVVRITAKPALVTSSEPGIA